MSGKKLFLFSLLLLLPAVLLKAQNVDFKAFAQSPVVVGEQFRVSFTVTNGETRDVKDLRAPDFQGFDVLMGPSTSKSSSTSIINGNVSSETSITYTYILMASKEGTYNIAPATVTVKGKQYNSNALVVKVLPKDKASQGGGDEVSASGSGISNDNLFVRAIVSKTNVYEQEALLVTYKLFSRYDLGVENANFPDFEGFVSQEIELPQDRQWSMDNYNGLNYRTVTLKQTLLYPQRSGEITIPGARVDCIVRIQNKQRSRNFFDDFFDSYQDVKKSISCGAVKINVKALPSGKPASFNGAVGDYKITSSLTPKDAKANESMTLKLQISGTGNLKFVKTPEINFPADFEQYDPKVDNNLKISSAGVSGTKTIEYLVIPRSEGDFKIPGVAFSFFDPKTGTYKTLTTETYNVHVAKGKGGSSSAGQVSNFTSKENIKLLGQDIRFIRPDFKLIKSTHYFFGSVWYWLCYILPTIILGVFFVIYRKRIAENANVALMKTKKANKVASKRLKQAEVYLKQNNNQAYYDELLKATWGYISDKLSIPLSNLTKDNVEAELTRYGVDNETIQEVMHILNTCEFARYAPSQSGSTMSELYSEAVDVINKIESIIKK
ncbi:MAG: BatD family protein [Bacteroidales bacterium]